MRTSRHGFIGKAFAAALIGAVGLSFAVPVAVFAQTVPAASAKAKAKKAKAVPAAEGEEAGDATAGPAGPGAAGAAAGKDPAVALAAYTAGVKSYQGGKYDAAVQSLNSAVNNGGLTAGQMPKALYYRGAAYQLLGKSGQAISDLTSALWFKPGLDDADRAEATKFRSAAYHDAGLDETGQAVRAGTTATGPAETGAVGTSTRMSALPTESSSSSGLGGIGKAFGKLFGGGAEPGPAPVPVPAPVAAVEPVAATPAGGEPEVLPWANQSLVAEPAAETGSPAPAAKPAAKPKASAPKAAAVAKAATPAKPGGAVRIQVASVKSRDEASAIMSKLQGMGGEISGASASVDETTFGSSTFYRVRLGPFASAAATAAPCKSLKAQGFDCLVTPN